MNAGRGIEYWAEHPGAALLLQPMPPRHDPLRHGRPGAGQRPPHRPTRWSALSELLPGMLLGLLLASAAGLRALLEARAARALPRAELSAWPTGPADAC